MLQIHTEAYITYGIPHIVSIHSEIRVCIGQEQDLDTHHWILRCFIWKKKLYLYIFRAGFRPCSKVKIRCNMFSSFIDLLYKSLTFRFSINDLKKFLIEMPNNFQRFINNKNRHTHSHPICRPSWNGNVKWCIWIDWILNDLKFK